MKFQVNGHEYCQYYMLTDSIYLQWSSFVLTIHELQREKRSRFVNMQEGTKKDVERAFGVL